MQKNIYKLLVSVYNIIGYLCMDKRIFSQMAVKESIRFGFSMNEENIGSNLHIYNRCSNVSI